MQNGSISALVFRPFCLTTIILVKIAKWVYLYFIKKKTSIQTLLSHNHYFGQEAKWVYLCSSIQTLLSHNHFGQEAKWVISALKRLSIQILLSHNHYFGQEAKWVYLCFKKTSIQTLLSHNHILVKRQNGSISALKRLVFRPFCLTTIFWSRCKWVYLCFKKTSIQTLLSHNHILVKRQNGSISALKILVFRPFCLTTIILVKMQNGSISALVFRPFCLTTIFWSRGKMGLSLL